MKGRQMVPLRQRSSPGVLPWKNDQSMNQLCNERTNLRQAPPTPPTMQKIKTLNKQIKMRAKTIMNLDLKEKGKKINELKEQRKMAKMWKNAKGHEQTILTKPKPLHCPGLSLFFKKHFNPDQSSLSTPDELVDPPQYIQLLRDSDLQIDNQPPSDEEISKAIKQLNKGKSSTDIESEILDLAYSIPAFQNNIKTYFELIWKEKQVPNQWRQSRITPIWKKKGSALDPSNYRGISTGSTLSKVGMKIILSRLSKFYERQLKRTQFGFRSGMGCNDAIYVVKQLQEIASISNKTMFACFIDLSAAFDHINRDMLFKTVRNRLASNQSLNTTNIDVLQNLYSSTTSYLQNEDPEKDSFPTKSGVRQGGMEGPPLYNVYSDYALRVSEDRKESLSIPGLSIPYCIPNEATNREQKARAAASGVYDDPESAYADDLGVFSWNLDDLEDSINILAEVFSEFGLNINQLKTKTIVFGWENYGDYEDYPTTILNINGAEIENTKAFKYLGVWLESTCLNIGQKEMDCRINSALNAFAEHKKLFTNWKINLKTRIMFLNTLVRSRLTYGCHAWRPSTPELSKLNSTYTYMLRSMIRNGHARVNPPPSGNTSSDSNSDNESIEELEVDWRYILNNDTIYGITGTKTIQEYYENQQHNFIAHTVRRENNYPCKILTFHSMHRKKRGRKSMSILERTVHKSGMSKSQFLKTCFDRVNNREPRL